MIKNYVALLVVLSFSCRVVVATFNPESLFKLSLNAYSKKVEKNIDEKEYEKITHEITLRVPSDLHVLLSKVLGIILLEKYCENEGELVENLSLIAPSSHFNELVGWYIFFSTLHGFEGYDSSHITPAIIDYLINVPNQPPYKISFLGSYELLLSENTETIKAYHLNPYYRAWLIDKKEMLPLINTFFSTNMPYLMSNIGVVSIKEIIKSESQKLPERNRGDSFLIEWLESQPSTSENR